MVLIDFGIFIVGYPRLVFVWFWPVGLVCAFVCWDCLGVGCCESRRLAAFLHCFASACVRESNLPGGKHWLFIFVVFVLVQISGAAW